MNFCEAMDKLQTGAKVTRKPWDNNLYFQMDGEDVKSFQPKLAPYIYNEDIMISDGWVILGEEAEYKFCDIIPFLVQGKKAKLKEWTRCFIYFDPQTKSLILHSMEIMPFVPDFESFVAIDWIEIQ